MDHKSFSQVEIKNEDRGEVSAVFATLGVIDKDNDVTVRGAFENGARVAISAYGHKSWEGALPVGTATIREVGDEAVMDGRFFMDTTPGRDTFATVKGLAESGLGEWSYGYEEQAHYGEFEGKRVRFLDKLKVYEVSPVMRGAGEGTRTLAAKSGMKFSEHIESVMADVDALVGRAAEVLALRAEKGKAISGTSSDLLGRLDESLKRLRELIAEPQQDTSAEEVQRLLFEFQRNSLALTAQGA